MSKSSELQDEVDELNGINERLRAEREELKAHVQRLSNELLDALYTKARLEHQLRNRIAALPPPEESK